jgi:hypothetical protein
MAAGDEAWSRLARAKGATTIHLELLTASDGHLAIVRWGSLETRFPLQQTQFPLQYALRWR